MATFPIGTVNGSTACATVNLIDDDTLEGDETLSIDLVSVTDSSGMGNAVNLASTDVSGIITITDNEGELRLLLFRQIMQLLISFFNPFDSCAHFFGSFFWVSGLSG